MVAWKPSLVVLTLKAGDPMEVVDDLSWAAWKALAREEAPRKPADWARLHDAYLAVFRGRTKLYKGCGETVECRRSHAPALAEGPPFPEAIETVEDRYFIFEIRSDAETFVEHLARMVLRMLPQDARTPALEDRLLVDTRHVLAKYLLFNARCAVCGARSQTPERRLWGPRD